MAEKKPRVQYLEKSEQYFNYTMRGTEQYRSEVAILTRNGYTLSEHAVSGRDGTSMTVAVLYRNGTAVKAYEL